MLRVGLSGGIGSGKSTVARLLVERGALLIDSDVISREVVAVGTPGLAAVIERFGREMLAADGSLDRPALGRIVFEDAQARADLNAIVHPRVLAKTLEQFARAPQDSIVLHDIPLLVELGRSVDYHLVVIVDTPAQVRLQRLVTERGMTTEDAQARIAAQATDEQRRSAADVLLPNASSLAQLHGAVDALWDNRIQPYADNLRTGTPHPGPAQIELTAYDATWPVTADRLIARIGTQLRNAGLGAALVAIDHIGSTSVPGLAAQDVIDLQVRLDGLASAQQESFVQGMTAAGFVGPGAVVAEVVQPFAPEEAQWEQVLLGGADPGRVVHLHVRAAGSAGATSALLLRDWLRAHDGERDAYGEVKQRLIQRAVDGQAGQASWIADALLRARAWAVQTGWSPDLLQVR